MKYKIIKAIDPDKLEDGVNYALADGYEPVGGVLIDSQDDLRIFYQAVIKKTWNPPPRKGLALCSA